MKLSSSLLLFGINSVPIVCALGSAKLPEHDFEKTDVIRSGTYGAVIGVILASLMLALPTVLSIESPVGNMPFIFGAIVVLGFSTWEGGLLGIQRENQKFAFVNDDIHHGEHLMIVDYDENASSAVEIAPVGRLSMAKLQSSVLSTMPRRRQFCG